MPKPAVVDLAAERMRRSPCTQMTHAIALTAIAEAIDANFPTRAEQVAAFGPRVDITVDLRTGHISLRPTR